MEFTKENTVSNNSLAILIKNSEASSEEQPKVWLIIFNDLLSLILCFLVLLYMSYTPDHKKWEALGSAIKMTFSLKNFGEFSINKKTQQEIDKSLNVQSFSKNYLEKLIYLKFSEQPSLLKYKIKIIEDNLVIDLTNKEGNIILTNEFIKDLQKLSEIFITLRQYRFSCISIEKDGLLNKFEEYHEDFEQIVKILNDNGVKTELDITYKFQSDQQPIRGILIKNDNHN
ncbi:flagellar motor protein MotB [Rickettsiales endosymbiont of Stachyamoeba lipophora]|uniref:flagellar motor protein MotB n=1 Tax=Rickettsiales endosymbiont of Stachyamoeba lipophora TaxID=2486578 RepID=UPI000F64BD5C|nr:flagellar motor protein MotB [Rickettsiales endosymbiont of Stachyamoeba lipophora]AZL15641.1 hypothetical protein EF513_03640 [Rickettsiales endosymbiont of Stachyamoeba lipophora]